MLEELCERVLLLCCQHHWSGQADMQRKLHTEVAMQKTMKLFVRMTQFRFASLQNVFQHW